MDELIKIIAFNTVNLVPCSIKEIDEIELKYGFSLPIVYKKFLSSMGKYAENFMAGSMCYYEDLDLINKEAVLLLEEGEFCKLPNNAFVFWMHQGYQFAFFLNGEESDPPVYYYNETIEQNSFIKGFSTLTDFFYSELELSVSAGLLKKPKLPLIPKL